jgi:hypothetical protein
MKPVLLAMSLCACVYAKAQYALYVKNDDTVQLRLKMRGNNLDAPVAPGTAGPYTVSALYPSTEYALYSPRGNFGCDESGALLPKGQYILIFMWNQKNRLYRTVLRPKTDND